MNKLVTAFSIITFFLSASLSFGQNRSSTEELKIEMSDIELLIGDWEGSLTYLDYSSNKPYSMPCNVTISTNKDKRKINLQYTFPNEPKANSKEKIKITKEGTRLNNEKISSKITKPGGHVEIQVETSGNDGNDNKPALIRQSYIINVDQFIIRKDVKFMGTDSWILRNEFNFNRVK